MSETTDVVFRVWKEKQGGVIALFPYEDADGMGHCSSFEHVGQHGAASYAGVIARTRSAKPEEYAALKHELESAPYEYNLRVVKRAQRIR